MAGLRAVAACGQGADRAREDLLSGITPGKQLRLKKTGARTPYASKAKTSSACRFCHRCRGLELKFNSLSSKANTLPCRGGTIATIPRNPKPASSGPSGGLGGALSVLPFALGLSLGIVGQVLYGSLETLDFYRELPVEHLLPGHLHPISGRERVAEFLTNFRDLVQYMQDQSILSLIHI